MRTHQPACHPSILHLHFLFMLLLLFYRVHKACCLGCWSGPPHYATACHAPPLPLPPFWTVPALHGAWIPDSAV